MLKRTPLFSAHQKLGAKLIDFGGWEMPVQYTSIVEEHLAVRNAAGIFDISHMGEVTVSGAGAADFLNHALTNDIRKLASGQGQYTLMCNERGGVIDDLYAYRLSDGVYLLIINASRVEAGRGVVAGAGRKISATSELQAHRCVAQLRRRGRARPAREGIHQRLHPRRVHFARCASSGVTDLKKNQIGGFQFRTWRRPGFPHRLHRRGRI